MCNVVPFLRISTINQVLKLFSKHQARILILWILKYLKKNLRHFTCICVYDNQKVVFWRGIFMRNTKSIKWIIYSYKWRLNKFTFYDVLFGKLFYLPVKAKLFSFSFFWSLSKTRSSIKDKGNKIISIL